MPKTITISDDVYEALLKIKKNRSFSELLRSIIKKEGNFNVLMIGFGSRNKQEMEQLKTELKAVEEEIQKWM
jgi:predicted CopG family antitoxin